MEDEKSGSRRDAEAAQCCHSHCESVKAALCQQWDIRPQFVPANNSGRSYEHSMFIMEGADTRTMGLVNRVQLPTRKPMSG